MTALKISSAYAWPTIIVIQRIDNVGLLYKCDVTEVRDLLCNSGTTTFHKIGATWAIPSLPFPSL